MSSTSPVKFRVFRREFLRNHSMNWTQIFRENFTCYALSIFRVFILLASSDSDKHVNEAKSVNKDLPIRLEVLKSVGSKLVKPKVGQRKWGVECSNPPEFFSSETNLLPRCRTLTMSRKGMIL